MALHFYTSMKDIGDRYEQSEYRVQRTPVEALTSRIYACKVNT